MSLASIVAGFSSVILADENATERLFSQLTAEAGLKYRKPEGYVETQATENSLLQYEKALRSKDGALEIRYTARPLSRLNISYIDPHGAIPEPNHIFPLMFRSLVEQLSNGGHSPSQEYPVAQANELFNADWAAAAAFDANEEYSEEFKQALLIAIHKNKKADAYIVYLYNDYTKVKKEIKNTLSVLSFKK